MIKSESRAEASPRAMVWRRFPVFVFGGDAGLPQTRRFLSCLNGTLTLPLGRRISDWQIDRRSMASQSDSSDPTFCQGRQRLAQAKFALGDNDGLPAKQNSIACAFDVNHASS